MLNGSMDSLVAEMERLLDMAEKELAERQQAVYEAQGEVRRLRSMLKVAGAEEPMQVKPRQKRSRTGPRNVNADTYSKVLAAIREHALAVQSPASTAQPALPDVPGSFCASDITGDFHETSARAAIMVFREEGLIRAVGKKQVGRARSPIAYALVNDEQ